MKKIIIMIMCLLMCGCNNKDSVEISESVNEKEELKSENNAEISSDVIKKSNEQDRHSKVYKAGDLTKKLFEKYKFPNPTTIHCFIGEDKMNIGFVYNYDLNLSKEERNQEYPKDSAGNPYLYYGLMTQLSDSVYSVKGNYPVSWESSISKVSDEIDFFLVFKEDEMYFVFRNLPVEELKKISPSSFAKFISDYNEYFENCESCFSERIWNVEIEYNRPINYAAGVRTDDYFNSKGLMGPSAIDLFIGKDKQFLGFLYLYDISATEEDILEMPKDEFGNTYVYYGKMTKISDLIYSVKGDYISSWKNQVPRVSENVDFYLKLEYDKLFIIFDECTLEELIKYDSQSYATFYKYN